MVDAKLLIEAGIGVAILAAIAVIGSYWSTITGIVSGEWARSIERARQQKAARERLYGYASVNHSQNVMSRHDDRLTQTQQTDADRRRVSEAEQWLDRVRIDKTKTAWLELMVYSGYSVPEIRAIIKGDNGTIGNEIEAARQRLGIQPPAPYITPIVGRPTSARFESDPDFPYQAPAT